MNRKQRAVTAFGVAFLMVLTCFFGLGRASAASYEEKLKKTQERKAELEQMLADEKARKAEFEENLAKSQQYLAELTGEIDKVMAYIEEIDKQLQAVSDRLETLNLEIDEKEQELEQTRKDLAEAVEAREKQYDVMKSRIRYIYENGNESIWDIIVNSKGFESLLNRVEYRMKITEYDNSLLDRYKAAEDLVAANEAYLEASLENLEELKQEAEAEYKQHSELAARKGEQLEEFMAKRQLEEEIVFNYGEEIDKAELSIEDIYKLQEEQQEEEARIRKEEQERLAELARQAEIARQREAAERAERERQQRLHAAEGVVLTWETSINKMIWPLPGDGRTYSGFGPRVAPLPGATTFHQGVDIGGEYGATLVAVLAGRVTIATYSSSAGNYIQVDHGNGVCTRYCHCSQLLVKVGDTVMQGQAIGLVGSTGVSTGPHVHFAVLINGTFVDPMKYIKYK